MTRIGSDAAWLDGSWYGGGRDPEPPRSIGLDDDVAHGLDDVLWYVEEEPRVCDVGDLDGEDG